ncbi:MAG TPA: hypothetical protein VI299_30035 [Polyangiales bacterium]
MNWKAVLAVVLASAGCGDDAPSDDADKSDAGEVVSEELRQARVTDGVHADQSRADVLIEALCRNAPRCRSGSEEQCQSNYNDGWMNLVVNQAPEACRDAELDRIACLGELGCAASSGCSSFEGPVRALCPEDAGM